MGVQIISEADKFFLIGESKGEGFRLIVDCSKQLELNQNQKLDKDYSGLLEGFQVAQDSDSLHPLIRKLNLHFRLYRRSVLKPGEFAPILAQYLDEIRRVPEASKDAIGNICNRFEEIREEFSRALKRPNPLPDVSLSKLLHCVNPASFWILDSRVNTVLYFWGYAPSYYGFGGLLKDLFSDSEFDSLRTFLEQQNKLIAGSDQSCSFLKLLDKVLWFA